MNTTLVHIWGRRLSVIALGLTLAFAAAGCGGKTAAPPVEPAKTEGNAAISGAATAKRTSYPLTVKDATGKSFEFAKAPERIASVSPSETETLFALGLGDKIVGVSDYCDYPAEAKAKPKLGGIVKPNEEALIAAHADLVMTGVSMKGPATEQLRSLGIPLFKVEPKTMDDVMNNILLMGQIFDKQEQAQKLVDTMKADRKQVVDAVAGLKPEQKKKVLVEFSPGWTVGSGEFLSELVDLAGGINIYGSEKGFLKLSEETVIVQNPQVILFPSNLIDDQSKKPMDQLIRERSGWEKIDAVRSNRLAGIDKDTTSRPGPRITQGLNEIAKGIYPDLVK